MKYGVIFFSSLAILGYEITFTRIFSYAQWHNLSPVIITMALLGSGISGTAVTLLREHITSRKPAFLLISALLLPLFMFSGFVISAALPLNPYTMSFSMIQVFYITIYVLLMCLPFLAGSAIICILLMGNPPNTVYSVNLIGSAAGAALPLALAFYMHPYSIMTVIIFISLIPAILMAFSRGIKITAVTLAAACFISMITFSVSENTDFRKVSQYKPISGALNLPGGRIIHESYSPLAVVQVVEAEGLRSASGLSIISPRHVPAQRIIFFDGDSPSAITPFTGDIESISYIRDLASWLPYYMKSNEDKKSVLIIGAGGGEPILKAVASGFTSIDAVELNTSVVSLMTGSNAEFSGGIYYKKGVTIHNDEGRSFVRRSSRKFDLIDIPMLDAYNSAASGVYALNESYIYTVESFTDFYKRLSPGGILSVTRWLTTPPRDSLKILNTFTAALRKMNIDNPGAQLLAIRSLQTITLLVSESPFSDRDIDLVKKFCGERLFDIIYYPGIKEGVPGEYIREKDNFTSRAFIELLSHRSEEFTGLYHSDISPPDDNRPYFYNFFRPAFFTYIKKYGTYQVPVTEWGYLLLLIILIPVAFISFFFILYPVLRIRERGEHIDPGLIPYFSLIAVGFFFIEMPMIQKMILFLGSPVFSMGIIISALLIFSGIGSLVSGSFFRSGRGIQKITFIICVIMVLYSFSLDALFSYLLHATLYTRIILIIIIIAPAAFFMGMPFPKGLELLCGREQSSLPLAWGVNGFFSVISIISAAICAVVYGYRGVLMIAVICYMAAGMISLSPGFIRGKDISSS